VNGFMELPGDSRRQVFEEASARLGLPSFSMEKDYWVFLVLDALFSNPGLGPCLTFKGGTSLSKVWKIIERFSEDIDIVIERSSLGFSGNRDPENAYTASARKRLVDELKSACTACAVKEIIPALTSYLDSAAGLGTFNILLDEVDKDRQTVLVKYESILAPRTVAYIMPSVKIELGARSGNEPVSIKEIRALIDEAIPGRPWAQVARVRALDPRRTFLEKAFLIHEEIHRSQIKPRKIHLSRHLYDLFRLIKAEVGESAIRDKELFERVLKNRSTLFAYSWIDYATMKVTSLHLCPPDDQIESWRNDYQILCREMIYGTPPDFSVMIEAIHEFEDRFMTQGD
jgi:hypothetical protein